MQTYIVSMGDTLYGISSQFGVSIEDIKLENNLSSNVISVGQVLIIPTTATTSFYIVKKDDTLYSIAKKYQTTVKELMELNNLSTPTLKVGQQLRLPINENDTTEYIVYSVKVGDSLYSIAKKTNSSVDEIKTLNNLQSDLLSIGQQLKIPVKSTNDNNQTNYETYTVKKGDTLYQIANTYGMSVDELMKINNLTTSALSVGETLKVKKNYYSNIPLGAKCYGEGYKEPEYLTYTVKRGDNLYNIAKKYNVSVDSIIELNNLKNPNLSIGQILKIKEVN